MSEIQVEVLISFMHRIATALERHTEVMCEHTALLRQSLELHRENIAIGRKNTEANKTVVALRKAESGLVELLKNLKITPSQG